MSVNEPRHLCPPFGEHHDPTCYEVHTSIGDTFGGIATSKEYREENVLAEQWISQAQDSVELDLSSTQGAGVRKFRCRMRQLASIAPSIVG